MNNAPMSSEALRASIGDLYARRDRGEVHGRRFERELAEKTVELYRSVIKDRLQKDEAILGEHHVIHSHLRLSQSILRDPDQIAVSLFGTDRRLLRIRSVIAPGRPVTCDQRDQTVVDVIPYSIMRGLHVRREIRTGEMTAGVVICVVALLFRSWLWITGTLLIALGVLGIIHGLLLPTRWIEIELAGDRDAEPVRVHGLRRGSARRLVRLLREKVAGSAQYKAT
ncbi:MAG: hypothetical protein AB1714_25885 [Acidobacteriota bacterium]